MFRAFSEPDYLTRWFSPSEEIATEILDFDFREGGQYRFGFRFLDGHKDYVLGVYLEIVPPYKLVFSWTWQEPDPHAGIETLVSIELRELGGETEVVVRHERFPNQQARDRHEEGWKGALGRLAVLIEVQARTATNQRRTQ